MGGVPLACAKVKVREGICSLSLLAVLTASCAPERGGANPGMVIVPAASSRTVRPVDDGSKGLLLPTVLATSGASLIGLTVIVFVTMPALKGVVPPGEDVFALVPFNEPPVSFDRSHARNLSVAVPLNWAVGANRIF